MILSQWIIIDHHTLLMLWPRRLLKEFTYASKDMLLWNLAAYVSAYTRILMDIWAVREWSIIADPSVSWGHMGDVVLLAVCTAVSMQCHMKKWQMFTKTCKVKSIPYVATGLPANVFLTVWGMWKFYHCASEKCTIQIFEALLGISYWAAGFTDSLIRSDLILQR